jgi:hypothetical protein
MRHGLYQNRRFTVLHGNANTDYHSQTTLFLFTCMGIISVVKRTELHGDRILYIITAPTTTHHL